MKKLTIRGARKSLTHLEHLLEVEGRVMVTRRGEPIAQLVPVGRKKTIPSHRDLREAMPRMRKRSERLIHEDRDAR